MLPVDIVNTAIAKWNHTASIDSQWDTIGVNQQLELVAAEGVGVARSVFPIKLVPIRQLFDDYGSQVCHSNGEVCFFYVGPLSGGSCNHCDRGIPNNKPHRLCPVLR